MRDNPAELSVLAKDASERGVCEVVLIASLDQQRIDPTPN